MNTNISSQSISSDSDFIVHAKSDRIEWWLRIIVALQCVGIGGRYLFSPFETESDVYGWLFFDHGWPEATANRIDDFGTAACLVAGLVILIAGVIRSRWNSTPLNQSPKLRRIMKATGGLEIAAGITVAVWFWALATTHMIRGGMYAELAWGEQAVRFAAPLALIGFVVDWRPAAWCLLRLAAAATFIVHGYKALCCYGSFTDLILLTDARTLQWQWDQSAVETLLVVIGAVDVVAGLLLILTRWRFIAIYMAVWGIITALSRMTAFGWEAWPETLLRAANGGVPFIIALAYRRRRD